MYTGSNHPLTIKIDMDYCADPVWTNSETEYPFINDDLDSFPFPKDLLHLLKVYQETWETVNNTKYISICEDISSPEISNTLYNLVDTLQKQCTKEVYLWIKMNGWNTKVYVDKGNYKYSEYTQGKQL